MKTRIGARLSYANVTATLALFLALTGGIAWALERNEVKSRHIAPENVRGSDLDQGAVTFGKIGPVAVQGFNIGPGSIEGSHMRGTSVEFSLDFPTIAGNNCARITQNQLGGLAAVNHLVVTPPDHFADTFTLTGKVDAVDPGTAQFIFVACNVFDAGSTDPDAGGGDYGVLMILD